MQVRRATLGAELGGPMSARYATAAFFTALWLVYVGASASNAYSGVA